MQTVSSVRLFHFLPQIPIFLSLFCVHGSFFMAIVFSHWSLHTVDHIENTRTSFQFSDLFFFRTSVLHMTRLTRKKSTYTPKMLFEVKRKIQRNKTNKIHLGIVAFAERFTAIKKNVLFIVTYRNVCVCSILSIVLFSVVVHVHYIYIYWLLTFFSATWNVLAGCVCVCATVDIRCLHIVSEIIVVIRNNQHQVIIIIIINTVPKKHQTKRRNKLHVLLPSKCLRFHDIQNRMKDQQQRNENEEVNNGFWVMLLSIFE